jgi:hypothetical protein
MLTQSPCVCSNEVGTGAGKVFKGAGQGIGHVVGGGELLVEWALFSDWILPNAF